MTSLGANAFWNGGPNITIYALPHGLTKVEQFTFTYCSNVKITSFGSNGAGEGLTFIGTQAFYNITPTTIQPALTAIYINKSVTEIASQAFSGYFMNSLTNVYFANSESTYNLSWQDMGFNSQTVKVTFDYQE